MSMDICHPTIVTMQITAYMERLLKEYPFFLEIEMLQGKSKNLPDGRIEYSIKIYDKEKSEILKDFILMMFSNSHNQNLN